MIRLPRRRSASASNVHPEPVLERASPEDRRIVERAMPYTLTGAARLQALVDAVRYCEARGIPGAYAECGVWRGGSVLAMILTLQAVGATGRDIYLYDTFEGMTKPTELDTSKLEPPALETWRATEQGDRTLWAEMFDPELFNEASVRSLLLSTGYEADRLHFVRGPVEQTIPASMPDELALLRLDTDWYESTRHELRYLFPRLAAGGVLIIDDYGHWQGARRAVDEYLGTEYPQLLLSRIDYAARIAVKF